MDNKAYILNAINDAMFNMVFFFNNKVPIDILGKIVKDILLKENIKFILNNKRVSPNKYIKIKHISFIKLIETETSFKVIKNNNRIFISNYTK